eukprot:333225_1
MSAPKSYTQTELNKMSKKKMRHILQEDYGKTAEEVKLGHLCKPYRELISKCQGSTDAKSQAANAKPKIKFVAPPINDQFERAKAKVAKGAERKDQIEDEMKQIIIIIMHQYVGGSDLGTDDGVSGSSSSHSRVRTSNVRRGNGFLI